MFLIILTIATIFQSFITTVPLVLIILLFMTIITFDKKIFLYALIFGLILDLFLLRDVGISSIYFLIFIFLIRAYSNKYEIKTPYFIVISSFLGSLFYLLILKDPYSILESLIISFFALLFFILSNFLKKKYLVNRF